MPAPIALFTYNRPLHTLQVLEALQLNTLSGQSELYIFCDGPKIDSSAEIISNINEVRRVIRLKKWCKTVKIFERPTNMGLANSIISGVSLMLQTHERIIVLEDDIVPLPYFLSYMNEALTMYENETDVISISSFNFFAKSKQIPDFFFSSIIDCWGWATWRRGWNLFEKDADKLLTEINTKQLLSKFNVNGAYDYYGMLKETSQGTIDSWAIRWYASGFVNNKLSLYPKISLTKNIGFDGTGVNSKTEVYESAFSQGARYPAIKTRIIRNDEKALQEFYEYFNPKLKTRLILMVNSLLKRVVNVILKNK